MALFVYKQNIINWNRLHKLCFMKKKSLPAIVLVFAFSWLNAQTIVSEKKLPGAFSIVSGQKATAIYVDASDFFLVQKAAAFLQSDIEKVTGQKPELFHTLPSSGNIIKTNRP